MPAASPRRQASPEDITLTSARTTSRREGLAGLGIRHGRRGSSGREEEEEEEGGAAKEAVGIDMGGKQVYCTRVEVRAPAAGDDGEAAELKAARGAGEGWEPRGQWGIRDWGDGPAALGGGRGGAGGLEEAASV